MIRKAFQLGFCRPLLAPNGQILGYVCSCEATATYCVNFIVPSF